MTEPSAPVLSIIIPVYNERAGIDALNARLSQVLSELEVAAEVVLVDDHSTDDSLPLLKRCSAADQRFRYIRLARNSGSHLAIFAGLAQARGACAVFMAADLQDPPELIKKLLEVWNDAYDVVWAVRAGREGVPWVDRVFARLFYWLLNRFGEVTVPPDGADFALLDRRVINALSASVGANPSLLCEIAKLGFRQTGIPYVKQARKSGASKWTLSRKIKLVADTFVAFSYAPLRAMLYVGTTASVVGFLYALFTAVMHFVAGRQVQGWASLIVVVLVMGGLQMIMLGIIGEYLWRTLDEARNRPHYFVEDSSEEGPVEQRRP